ncbi:DinB family protein [Ruania alkalisoli]|uniref:DinB family protein n=1 Tax=Ruania alkalisoli TaxID=2779775 RepID=A0A7M1T0L6_9MICO|nr:DinB family protein [Ruania alkalisoli]QOR72433.1 DinB family protein [Ruania alkalisoli]
MTPHAALHRYLQSHREALLWKLDGLDERQVRWPMTPTGTNLLGLVKHMAGVEQTYFGTVFGREHPIPTPWLDDDAEPNADMWATSAESRESIVTLYRSVWTFADDTIGSLPLDAPGRVPWWGDRADVTLAQILVHVSCELARHTGHADIVRELLDGTAGLRPQALNLPDAGDTWWIDYREKLRTVAEAAGHPTHYSKGAGSPAP